MHACRIVTSSGKVYESAFVVAEPFSTLLRDDPHIRILHARRLEAEDVPLGVIVSAVTEGERITANLLGDKEELAFWKHIHQVYLENKGRLDALPERERAEEAEILCRGFYAAAAPEAKQ
jgi:hypothetical protein